MRLATFTFIKRLKINDWLVDWSNRYLVGFKHINKVLKNRKTQIKDPRSVVKSHEFINRFAISRVDCNSHQLVYEEAIYSEDFLQFFFSTVFILINYSKSIIKGDMNHKE